MTSLAPLLEAFFTDRLCRQRQASPNTVAAYRDAFRILLNFAQRRLCKAPSQLLLTDLDASLVGAFLDHLETERGNCVRARNARLAAIHSFFRYVSFEEPAHAALIQRVLAIPQKRFNRTIVNFLNPSEIEALLAAPDRSTWIGRRDHLLLHVAIHTGLRVSELIGLRFDQLALDASAHIRCYGKGRKERCTPLMRQAVLALKTWEKEQGSSGSAAVFPSRRGGMLSRDAVERIVAKYATRASHDCPSLKTKTVSPHVLRHTTAVRLLQAGVDRSTIALWLGHECVRTTDIYLDADLSIKEAALAKTEPLPSPPSRYRPNDSLMAFLEAL